MTDDPRDEEARAQSPRRPRGVPGNRWDLLDGLVPDPLPTVSVVVAHYRQQAELDRTLAALARQDHPAELLEVVVVDDGSPEAPRVPDGVRLVVQADEGFRLSAARNLGVRSSTGEVICFLDADTAPEPGWVTAMSRLPGLAPEAVVVGTRRHADFAGVPVDAPVEQEGPRHELPAPRWLDDAYRGSRDLLDADDRSYRHVIGAVLSCSRSFIETIGGFDEGFTTYGGEDWEWAWRAWRGGALLAHEPAAVAWHDGPDWAGRDSVDRQRQKNGETLVLSGLVPVEGSRPRGLRGTTADVLVRLAAAPSAGTAWLCVDTVLAALPACVVAVPDEHLPLFAADPRVVGASDEAAARAARTARVTVDLPAPVRVRDAAPLLEAVASVGVGTLGTVEVVTAGVAGDEPDGAPGAGGGAPVLRIRSSRAEARALLHGTEELFETRSGRARWCERIEGEPSLAAYLGGWG
ncbi:glycosyltransferase family 2 protein [Frigoribacterium sp. PvP032]|uniref:glycosyltransferase family 2 protein n=1 Tax=Frigoribacterium sp. PvP032 TaxID=2806589 RepID=UPI001AE6554B|nr:glycosyltransferase [Frigoribacterium sp. PvP032]MBP1190737.1 GT2 family glycosyltransferase [Frigoribacterium sp. PvP032]